MDVTITRLIRLFSYSKADRFRIIHFFYIILDRITYLHHFHLT